MKSLVFKVLWEEWSKFRLDTGLVLKLKIPLKSIQPANASSDAQKGMKLYKMIGNPLSSVEGEFESHEPSKDETINPSDIVREVRYEIQEENPQVYYLPEIKSVLVLKPVLKKAFLTSKYDSNGLPISSLQVEARFTILETP